MSKPSAIEVVTRMQQEPVIGEVQDQIRQRAYELYEARGAVHGHDLEDWVMAESEILAQQQVPRAA
jgi:hypothetical protein